MKKSYNNYNKIIVRAKLKYKDDAYNLLYLGGKLNMKTNLYKNILIIGLITLFIGGSIVSGINKNVNVNTSDLIQYYEKISDGINTANSPTFTEPDDDWDYWTNPPNMFSNVSGYMGIGTSTPTNKLTIVGSDTVPLVNIEQSGQARALRVNSTNKCAIWVEYSGNHGLRVTQANGDGVLVTNANVDGIHVDSAGVWAGYFNGSGYFAQKLGIGTLTPNSSLEVAGVIHSTDGGFKFPDGTIQTTAATGGGGGNNSLDQAYDQGGPGAGRTITADSGAVNIAGSDGLTVNGNVGINTTSPGYELDVNGYAQATGLYTGDVVFKNEEDMIWRIFGDENNLYLKNLLTGITYRFLLIKTDNSADLPGTSSSINLEQEIINLYAENQELKERIEALEVLITK